MKNKRKTLEELQKEWDIKQQIALFFEETDSFNSSVFYVKE
jgi:hypothetical protein